MMQANQGDFEGIPHSTPCPSSASRETPIHERGTSTHRSSQSFRVGDIRFKFPLFRRVKKQPTVPSGDHLSSPPTSPASVSDHPIIAEDQPDRADASGMTLDDKKAKLMALIEEANIKFVRLEELADMLEDLSTAIAPLEFVRFCPHHGV